MRRVVAKAEHLAKGANPRFIVTSLGEEEIDARRLYERIYCARGRILENRLKEQQLDLYADRTFCTRMPDSNLARATSGTLRTRLLKIGAQVRVSVRRIQVRLYLSAVAYELMHALRRLQPAGDGVWPGRQLGRCARGC